MRASDFMTDSKPANTDHLQAWTLTARTGDPGMTPLGMKYEKLYLNYYKKRFYFHKKQGLGVEDAMAAATKDLQNYKDRVRTGEYDPISRTRWWKEKQWKKTPNES